jgi:hypothetical protein
VQVGLVLVQVGLVLVLAQQVAQLVTAVPQPGRYAPAVRQAGGRSG